MADNTIELVARVNVEDSAKLINEHDIPSLQAELKTIKISCELSQSDLNNIKAQLASLKESLNFTAPSVNVNTSTNSPSLMTDLADNADKASAEVEKVTHSLKNLEDRFTQSFEIIRNNENFTDAEANIEHLRQQLQELGDVSIKGIYSKDEGYSGEKTSDLALEGLVATIKNAQGEMRTLRFETNATGGAFEYVSGTFDDKGVATKAQKLQKDINGITQEYDKLKGSVGNFNAGIFAELDQDGEKTVVTFKSLEEHIQGLANGTTSIEQVNAEMTALKGVVADLNAKLGQSEGKGFNRFQNAEIGAREFDTTLQQISLDIQKLDASDGRVAGLASDFEKLSSAVLELQFSTNRDNKWLESYSQVNVQMRTLKNNVAAVSKEQRQLFKEENQTVNFANRIKTLTANMDAFAAANKRAVESTQKMSSGRSFADEWARLSNEMAKGASLSSTQLKKLQADFRAFGKEAEAAGLKGESAFGKFLNSFKTMSSYITANMVFNFVKRQLRDMAEEVVAVDTAMTELKKVTEATDVDFEKFAQSAAKTGRELGASVSDVINATATFARLGESLPDAEELGKVATLFKNVGDGITEEQAAEDLISTMKAFKIEAKDSITIVDKLNEVGNNYAISSGGIGEALKRSASALAAANNDLSESIALITTANTIAQDPATVGQGIKTMSLRIRSTKTQLEEMGEDAEGAADNVSKLRKQMLALTGVDIQLDENTYKSTYQILLEISKVWAQLDDMSQASALELLFGKRQANIGAAILENGQLLEQVYQSAENSAGSALKEQEKYSKSIQYSIDSMKAAYQGLSQTLMSSDFLKGLVDTGANLLEIIDNIVKKVGLIPPLLTSIAAVRGFQGKGRLPKYAYLRTVALCA